MIEDPVVTAILSSTLTALCTFLATLYAAVHPLKRKYDALMSRIIFLANHDFDVALDGIKESGKSALIAKWMNPTTDIRDLGATSAWALHDPVQMCNPVIEGADGKPYEHRYRLIFHDFGGEFRPELGQVLIEKNIRAAILVIDPTHVQASLDRFSGGTLHMSYLTKHSLDHLICMLVYISKSDLVSEEQLRATEQQVRERLLPVIGHRFSEPYNLRVVRGSAATGEGLFEAQAFVAEQFGFAQYLQKHKSLASGAR